MKVNKDMTIGETVSKFPETAEILMSYGMMCVCCPSAQGETIEEAAMVHGIDLNDLMSALNK